MYNERVMYMPSYYHFIKNRKLNRYNKYNNANVSQIDSNIKRKICIFI